MKRHHITLKNNFKISLALTRSENVIIYYAGISIGSDNWHLMFKIVLHVTATIFDFGDRGCLQFLA